MGPKKKVSDFLRITIGKTSSGDASTVGKVSSQDDSLLNLQFEEVELGEAMKMTHAVLDPDANVLGFTSNEKDAVDMSKNNLRKVKGKVFPLSKPISQKKADMGIGKPLALALKDEVELGEMAYKPGSFKDTRPQEKTAKALDDLIMKGGLDKNDFRQARILYVQTSDPKSRKKLRDFIQDLDTSPAEAVMDIIGRNDPDTFEKMYPDAKSGEFLSKISFRHRKIKNEEVEIDEKYDLYHKDFSSAMQHAYDYAKSKMGITVDPKEIDSKVATGPKKPTEGKTNKYMLKGKGGNLQIQVYNKGGSKPFELNMYKEENDLISQASRHISHMQMSERKIDPADVDDNASEKDVEDAGKNIIMQLRKSVSMRGNKDVEFASGKQKVDMKIAQKALDMYNKMKPQDKTKFQTTIAKSYKDLLNAIKGN